jgi:RNA polymerase sigma-70 factor (ECF subfamily)
LTVSEAASKLGGRRVERTHRGGNVVAICVPSRAPDSVGITWKAHAASSERPDRTQLAVALAKQGDRDALRFLYVTYSPSVYGYVHSIVRDTHDAEDVTQHVFTKLITTVAKYEERGASFSAWLIRMARNLAIDHLRAGRYAATASGSADTTGPSTAVDLDRAQAIKTALAALPRTQRQVIVLRHLFGLTPAEIADRMGRTECSIHCLHHRGRRTLQRELIRLGCEPHTRSPEERNQA